MARPLRIQYPGAFYHITSRGNERKPIFKSKEDRQRFLGYLQSSHEKYGAIVHAYCLLPNHYHLLLETPRSNLSQVLHHMNASYTTYFNLKWKRSGHLFQGRYKAILVEKEVYAQELSRYIHLNPLRAGLVKDLVEYRWSSFRCHIGLEKSPSWLETGMILGDFGSTQSKAQRAYRSFVEGAVESEIRNPLREAIASTFLGSQDFIRRVSRELGRPQDEEYRDVPALRALQENPSLDKIQKGVGEVIGAEDPLCEKFCLYLSRRFGGFSLKEIGDYYGMKGATVSQAARRFSERVRAETPLKKLQKEMIQKLGLLNVET